MTGWRKYSLVAIIVSVAGFAYLSRFGGNPPLDLRDAPAEESPAYNQLKGAGSDAPVVYDGNTNKTPGPHIADSVYRDPAPDTKGASSKTGSVVPGVKSSSVPVVAAPAKEISDTKAILLGTLGVLSLIVLAIATLTPAGPVVNAIAFGISVLGLGWIIGAGIAANRKKKSKKD